MGRVGGCGTFQRPANPDAGTENPVAVTNLQPNLDHQHAALSLMPGAPCSGSDPLPHSRCGNPKRRAAGPHRPFIPLSPGRLPALLAFRLFRLRLRRLNRLAVVRPLDFEVQGHDPPAAFGPPLADVLELLFRRDLAHPPALMAHEHVLGWIRITRHAAPSVRSTLGETPHRRREESSSDTRLYAAIGRKANRLCEEARPVKPR